MRTEPTIADAFDPKANSFDFLRLVFAVLVIYAHSYPLGGFQPADPLGMATGALTFGSLAVHGFFAASGFLIARSADRSASVGRFLWHRVLRIMPGYWVCLAVTVFVFTPLVHRIATGHWTGVPLASPGGGYDYLRHNWRLIVYQGGIGNLWSPNGSLWTLWPEAKCYLGLALLAVAGVLHCWRGVALAGWAGLCAIHWMNQMMPGTAGRLAPVLGFPDEFTELALCFATGAVLHLYRDHIPLTSRLAAAAAGLTVLGMFHGFYHSFAPLLLPYAVMWAACRIPVRNFGRWGDFSYGTYVYAFPVQMMLVRLGWHKIGGGAWGYFALSTLLTLLLAVASYHLVEKWALRAKNLPVPFWPERNALTPTVRPAESAGRQAA